MRLTFRITNRCNRTCAHCAFSASPQDNRGLQVKEMQTDIDQIVSLPLETIELSRTREPGIAFTGGEPFLRFDDLVETVRYARKQGIFHIACVTNASWATSLSLARKKMNVLKKAGLNNIRLSCDDFHESLTCLEYIRNALAAALEANISVGIKVVIYNGSLRAADILRSLEDLTRDIGLVVEEICLLPEGRARNLPGNLFMMTQGLPSHPCDLMDTFTIDIDRNVYPCCIPGWPRLLHIGNTRSASLTSLIQEADRNPLFKILQQKGPIYFIPFLEEAGAVFPPGTFVNRCHLCHEVLKATESSEPAKACFNKAIKSWEDQEANFRSILEAVENIWGFT